MNRTVASLTQWAGRLTVLIAFVFLIWSVSHLASESENPGFARVVLGPNQYLQVVVSTASIAVTGMLAVGITPDPTPAHLLRSQSPLDPRRSALQDR